ncbi:MAG TPA: DUF4138 domain-containing protein [Sphingobacteriaceae bacterium]|nr:DUF4138 domain-containing protein [Sphingobacteriaceae bacterium]
MKTLKIISILSLLFSQLGVFAQDTIYVSYNKVTAIQFPSRIESPVITSKNISAQIRDNNLLALNAMGTDFKPSNLEVKTIDGKSYKFPVSFSYGRAGRIFKLPKVDKDASLPTTPASNASISKKIAESRKGKAISTDKASKIKSELGNVAVSGDDLFYKLKVRNRSNIHFDIDFIRFYVRDIKTAKRTVTQEQEIYPVYSFGTEDQTIKGKSAEVYVFALKKFPLSKDKALFIEVYEKSGGRHQYLRAKQYDIENAKPIE